MTNKERDKRRASKLSNCSDREKFIYRTGIKEGLEQAAAIVRGCVPAMPDPKLTPIAVILFGAADKIKAAADEVRKERKK